MYNGKMETIYESEYMNLYDLQYREGGHYYCASRRNKDRMVALTPDEECGTMQPDAVSCFVVLNIKGQPKKLLLNWEYRYPVGQYMLSVPAGLIDKGDWNNPNALVDTAIRELKEETGIEVEESDEIEDLLYVTGLKIKKPEQPGNSYHKLWFLLFLLFEFKRILNRS